MSLIICRYSYEPIKFAISICGIRTFLFSYLEGDCKDYPTWLKADKGIKLEQTRIHSDYLKQISKIIKSGNVLSVLKYINRGNVFIPFLQTFKTKILI